MRANPAEVRYIATGRFFRKVDEIEDTGSGDLNFFDPVTKEFHRMRRVNGDANVPPDDGSGTPVALVA